MAFNKGVFDAPPTELAPCGLLSVARIVSWDDEPWLRGYEYEIYSTPTVKIVNNRNLTVTNGTLSSASTVEHLKGEGFVIEVENKQSAIAYAQGDPRARMREELNAVTQKAVEYELWEGVAIKAGSSGAHFLTKSGGATVVTTSGVDAAKALRALEQAISNSPVGGRGVIHMTRDVASELGSRLLYKGSGDSATEDRAITRLGTRVVIGSGYTGNGPVGETGASASATNKWMFATAAIEVELGPIELVTAQKSDALDYTVNDITSVLQRSAAVHFDPSIWYAAQVTLS